MKVKSETPEPPEAASQRLSKVDANADHVELRTIPVSIELLILATKYVHLAHLLTATIGQGVPDGPGEETQVVVKKEEDEDMEIDALSSREARARDGKDGETNRDKDSRYLDCLAAYRRYISAAIVCCSAAVKRCNGDIKTQLRAMLMLAELLVRETEEHERAGLIMSKGVAAASQHENFLDYRLKFTYLQVEHALSRGNVKFGKVVVKKILSDLQRDYASLHAWIYRFQLLQLQICQHYERDLSAACTIVNDLELKTRTLQHSQLHWTVLNIKARLAMLRGDVAQAGEIITSLATGFNIHVEDAGKGEEKGFKASPQAFETRHVDPTLQTLPRPLVLQFLVLLSIYQAHAGFSEAATHTIRRAQYLLDTGDLQSGEEEGHVSLEIPEVSTNLKPPQMPSMVTISTLPRAIFYAYTFLISTVVQLDPVGRQPKCMLYAAAGLNRLDQMIDFGANAEAHMGEEDEDFPFAAGPLTSLSTTVKQLAAMKIDLMLVHADLLLMRSALPDVRNLLLDLVALAQTYNLWDAYKSRILLLQAMLVGFLGDLDAAFDGYAAALECMDPHSELGVITRASMLLIRLTQGFRVRLSGSEGHTGSPTTQRTSLYPAVQQAATLCAPEKLASGEDLEGFAKEILLDCQAQVPTVQILALLIEAHVNGEISRAKQTLTKALELTSSSGNQHLKPLILALLACHFENTRNEQSLAMLQSAHTICNSMGGADKNRDKGRPAEEAGGRSGRRTGLAKLGLWIGTNLLDAYQAQHDEIRIQKQQEYNERFRAAIASQQEVLRSIM